MSSAEQPDDERGLDTFDVRGTIRAIVEASLYHRTVVLATCALTLVAVTIYLVFWPPVYTAQLLLMTEGGQDSARDAFYSGWSVFRKDDTFTELELMTSGPVLADVVEQEELEYPDVYHSFMSHLTYLWGESVPGKAYRAVKGVILGTDRGSDAPSLEELELSKTIAAMRDGIRIDPVAQANVGLLTVKGPSRRVAQVANTLADVYTERREDRYYGEAERAYEALTSQLARSEAEIDELEQRRLDFLLEHDLAFDLEKEGMIVAALTSLEGEIAATRASEARLEASLVQIGAQLEDQPPTNTTSTQYEFNAVQEALKQKRVELQTSLVFERNRYREDSPEIERIKSDIAALDALIADSSEKVQRSATDGINVVYQELLLRSNTLRSDLEGIRASLSVTEETAAEMRRRLAEVPALQRDLNALDREINAATARYVALLGVQAQAVASLASVREIMPSLRVVEYASTPDKKSWPKIKYVYPAALLLGLALGVAAAVVTSTARGRIRRADVERGRGSLPFYGTIGLPRADPAGTLLTVTASTAANPTTRPEST